MNQHAEMTDAAEAAASTVANVDASQLGRPTPDTDWDVRTLLNHLIVWTSFRWKRARTASRWART